LTRINAMPLGLDLRMSKIAGLAPAKEALKKSFIGLLTLAKF
jgi:hypothetical protein